MRTSRKIVVGVALALAAGMVQADSGGRHGGHWHGPRVGVVIGAPFGWYGPPFWYGPPYWYEPPVVVQSAPPVYNERGADVARSARARRSGSGKPSSPMLGRCCPR